MSDADEKNSEDLSFDFGSFADGTESLPSDSMSDGLTDASFDGFGETVPSNIDGSQGSSFGEFDAMPDMPSSFLTDSADTATSESATVDSEVVAPVIETTGKGKFAKNKKEKQRKSLRRAEPREPMDPGSTLSLCFGFVLLLALIVANALIFTAPETPGIGGSSTIFYAVAVNVFGLVIIGVPLLFWKHRKGKEPQQSLQLFDVFLGVALMAMAIGVLCLLTVFFRYDFTIK